MMRRFFLLFLVFIPLISVSQINQTDANGLRQGLWQKKQPNGRLLYEGNFKDGKPVGEWKRFHPGGQVKAIIQYRAGSDSAFTQLFDEWGKKVAEGNFVNEKKEGTWIYFSQNRKIADEHFKAGVKQGLAHKYYETGEMLEETEWKNGVQDGKYTVFYKSGKLFNQYMVSDNKRNGPFLMYFPNGKIELEANYKNGLRNGEWKYYNDQGGFLYELDYDNGELLNPQVRDSINAIHFKNLEQGKDSLTDPEKYIENPSEFMMKKNIYR